MSIGYPHWSAEAGELKKVAKVSRECVCCGTPLVKNQKFYCSSTCSAAFFYKHFLSWANIRGRVLERDGEKCVKCGAKAYEVHHVRALSEGGDPFDLSNLISVCSSCHVQETGYLRQRKIITDKIRHILILPPDRIQKIMAMLDAQLQLDEEQTLLA